ncbi:MoaA/NifB/PqqE/SkfB family radical SAM enzyme [Paenibacillus forsythiae]|uniref:MoaA/NifB/PqqE/SkfB family radical SAM enzyme n=1 Tax=Paenibacillus forsythiae TaxID=365616 RepID=A0ABU3HCM1_9BACL|nr:radical SAM protein [Paenibacillus forsythiae]MDT3427772.1 MoaA/NifB/PqqE/SkfB family radical SAM enzyme [Paenibacillus forsythiae]
MEKESITALLELTHRCNLTCKHCYNSSSPASTEELGLETVKEIIHDLNKLTDYHIEKVILTGGEFVYMKQAAEIYAYIREHFHGSLRIETNGLLFKRRPELFQIFRAEEYFISADTFHGTIDRKGHSELLDFFIHYSIRNGFKVICRLTVDHSDSDIIPLFLERYGRDDSLALEIKYVSPSGRASENLKDFKGFRYEENKELFTCLANNMIHFNVRKQWHACYTACNLSYVAHLGDEDMNEKLFHKRQSGIFRSLRVQGIGSLLEEVTNPKLREAFLNQTFYYRCEPCLYLSEALH